MQSSQTAPGEPGAEILADPARSGGRPRRRPAGAGAGRRADAPDEGAAERAALAGELFAPGVGAQAGPPARRRRAPRCRRARPAPAATRTARATGR